MNILAIIPARSGSKSVKDKNIRLINNKPMIAYSIEHAKRSKYINRVIVSTDSEKYAEIAQKYGAEVPFIRPAELATDFAVDYDVFKHAVDFLNETENYMPDIIVQLRPTYPIRNIDDIDKMIEMIVNNQEVDSVRCVAPAKEIAYKMWKMSEDGFLSPILNDIPEAYNMPRQKLPAIYYQNACIDVIRTNTILNKQSMSGSKILGYRMEHNFDIDTEEEFERASQYLQLMEGGKKFVFDIDGVIAEYRENLDYASAEPNRRMIKIINYLYDAGNTIVLFTARGYKTGIDWEEVTRSQMDAWGVKYHELKFGKPDADYYVDDKMLGMSTLLDIFGERK